MSAPTDSTPAQGTSPTKKSRLLFWLGCTGCLFGLLLVGVGGTMAYLLWQGRAASAAQTLPAAWRDSLALMYQLPEAVARLAPAPLDSTTTGDLDYLGLSSDSVRRARTIVSMRLNRGIALQAGDEAVLASTLADTSLGGVIAAARRARYDVLPRLADPEGRPMRFPPVGAGPRSLGVRIAQTATGLTLRGEAELRRGRISRARSDFEHALALGRLMWRTEPTLLDVLVTRNLIADAASGLGRVAARTGDTARVREAASIAEWRRGRFGTFYLLEGEADSLLSVAADTTLPRGVRVHFLISATQASVYSAARILFGPRAVVRRAVEALEQDADPVVARAAVVADSSLARLSELGSRGRYRLVTRGTRQ